MAHLELRGIGVRYGATTVLDDVSLEAASGELLVLVGPSGCGKSTLLRVIAGLVRPTRGDVLLDGARVNDLEPRARDVAMVFQSYALYPHMSVRDNIAFPLRVARRPRREVEQRVRATAAALGLEELLDRKPSMLSGGQMQRVALGRAIVRDPRLFLFDEPLSNLDAKLRGEMRVELARLHRRLGITTVYVTHDQAEAMTMGSRIALLEAGRLRQVGPPLEVFERPASTFVASFIGSPPMNLVEGEARGGRFVRGASSLPAGAVENGPVVLGIRPHQVRLAPAGAPGAGLPAQVAFVERLGSQTVVECLWEGARVFASVEGAQGVRAGERVDLELDPRALHFFDARSGLRLAGSAD